MDFILAVVLGAVLGYLLGSVSFAVIVSRLFGLADPRTVGSGNPGATNVLRSGNKLAAVLTLFGDAAKGWLAMILAVKMGAGEAVMAVAGLAAFLGHVFPFTLGFKGGKGVATALGVLIGFDPLLASVVGGLWLATMLISGYSSLSALFAALAAPIAAFLLTGRLVVFLPVLVMSVVLIFRHRTNIQNLMSGKESRMGRKKSGEQL